MDIFKLFNDQSVDVQDEINPGSLRWYPKDVPKIRFQDSKY